MFLFKFSKSLSKVSDQEVNKSQRKYKSEDMNLNKLV